MIHIISVFDSTDRPALTQHTSNIIYNTQHYGVNCTQQWLKDDSRDLT